MDTQVQTPAPGKIKARTETPTVALSPKPAALPVLTVRAHRAGTYPDVGTNYARFRPVGAVFALNTREDFASEWMVELGKDEIPEPIKAEIPQTTAPKRPAINAFPPMQ